MLDTPPSISFSIASVPSSADASSRLAHRSVPCRRPRSGLYALCVKRVMDASLALLALLVLSPLLLVLALALAVDLRGNPFFVQTRIGRNLQPFSIVKFRTMNNERDAAGQLLPDDARVTRFGALLRSTSLDELPELVNVLLGQMSLIGPRPWIPEQMATFSLSTQRKRMSVRPGVSGLAQVFGRNNLTFRQRVCYDLVYQRHLSFLQDLRIVFFTFYKVLKREGIAQRPDALSHAAPKDPSTKGRRGNAPRPKSQGLDMK